MVVLMGLVIPLATRKTEKPGEFYPFSNFPMYSRFESHTYYVYLRDLSGNVVPVSSTFGTAISNMKKVYDGNLNTLKKAMGKGAKKSDLEAADLQIATEKTLKWLVSIAPKAAQPRIAALTGLELHRVDIEFIDSKIVKKDSVVGSLKLPIPTPAP